MRFHFFLHDGDDTVAGREKKRLLAKELSF